MNELMAVERMDQLMQRGFDNIIVDTAPSRHAFDVFDKPELFAGFSIRTSEAGGPRRPTH